MTERQDRTAATLSSVPGLLLSGHSTFVVGVEPDDDEPEVLRMYVGTRAKGIYALVADPQAKDDLLRAWNGISHVVVATPPADRLYQTDAGRQYCERTAEDGSSSHPVSVEPGPTSGEPTDG